VKDIEAAVRTNNYKFSSLVMAIIKSEPFQKRRVLRPDEFRQHKEKGEELKKENKEAKK
jgi:hypothetical protein